MDAKFAESHDVAEAAGGVQGYLVRSRRTEDLEPPFSANIRRETLSAILFNSGGKYY